MKKHEENRKSFKMKHQKKIVQHKKLNKKERPSIKNFIRSANLKKKSKDISIEIFTPKQKN